MQCLYCETELKPLRGLFDEDFCCKDHREKYFSSFRKGISLLPVLDLPPLAPTQERDSEETVETGESVVELAAEEEVKPSLVAETMVEEPPVVESSPEPVLAIAEEAPPALEMAAQAPELPEVEETTAVASIEAQELLAVEQTVAAASVEAAFDEEDVEEAAFIPRAADFLHLHVAPSGAEDCYFMVEENAFSACNGPAIPDVEVFCDAAFDLEEPLARLFAADMEATGASGRTASPEPLPAVGARVLPFRAWDYAAPSAAGLEPGELIEDVEMFVAGDPWRETARFVDGQPLALPLMCVTMPAFHAAAGETHPHIAEAAEVDFTCQQIASDPLMFADMGPALEIHSPVFQVSAAAMQLEEELRRAIDPPKTEAARLAEPEIARPAAMSAAPVSRAVSAATFQPAMPVAAARPEAQLNVPAMSSKTDATPGLAPEAMPDPPRGAPSEQPPAAHSSDAVQPAIQNSVRIKNWRLKITFAKPA